MGIRFFIVVFGVWLVPVVAFAQEVASSTTEVPWWLQAIIAVSGVAMTFIMNLARKYFGKLMDLAAQKTKLTFLAQVDDVVMSKVAELWQVEIKAIKAAAKDGKLTAEEKDVFRDKAIAWSKSLLDVSLLADVFGGADNIDGALSAVVEKHVVLAKNAGKIAKAAAKNPSTP